MLNVTDVAVELVGGAVQVNVQEAALLVKAFCEV
jgi:hypothetical protein